LREGFFGKGSRDRLQGLFAVLRAGLGSFGYFLYQVLG